MPEGAGEGEDCQPGRQERALFDSRRITISLTLCIIYVQPIYCPGTYIYNDLERLHGAADDGENMIDAEQSFQILKAFSINISWSCLIYIFSGIDSILFQKRSLGWIHLMMLMQVQNLSESERSDFLNY